MIQKLNQSQQAKINELKRLMGFEINEIMQKNIFPAEDIHPQFPDWLTLALPHETPMLMRTSYEDFKKFWPAMTAKPVSDYTIWEMGFAINCVESKSMVQLSCPTQDEYIRIQDAITEMTKKWNAQATELKKPVVERYKILEDRVKDNKAIIMPTEKKIIT